MTTRIYMRTIVQNFGENRKKWALILAIVLGGIILFALPLSLKAKSYVYVDDTSCEDPDGSSEKPYNSIQKAIDKAEKKDRDVKIKKGTYYENFKIWSDVEVYGEDKDKVIIIAEDGDTEVVKMYHDSEIHDVSVKYGERGIYVDSNAKALIKDCIIEGNDQDGIKAEEGEISSEHQLEIRNCEIKYNGRNGIFVLERKVEIQDNEIKGNEHDGVELQAGTEGEIKGNDFEENEGDGLRFTLDESDLEIISNDFSDNGREGIEVRSQGDEGDVLIKYSKFNKNGGWGIARIEKAPFSDEEWKNSLVQSENSFWDNGKGTVSDVINVY